MTKTKKISVRNFKAISDLAIDFQGCTAIISGGNNKGKSSLLRGITDRIRGERPELIVKQGEKEGKGEIELTSGEKFIWEFDNQGTDKLIFITKDGYETKVTKEIKNKFFPPSFDIDKFLNSPPREQSKQLQKIVGIDFTEIDNRYKLAYDDRTVKNREAERYHAKLIEMFECPKVDPVELTELQAKKEAEQKRMNEIYLSNKDHNDKLRKAWNDEKDAINTAVNTHNEAQKTNRANWEKCQDAAEVLKSFGITLNLEVFVTSMFEKVLPLKEAIKLYPAEPVYIPELADDKELQAIDKQILEASETNSKAKEYADYIAYKTTVEAAQSEALEAEEKVKSIWEERDKLIRSAKMPKGIEFGEGCILIDGFPLDKNQISTSKLYCAALRIASMNLGDVRTLHFDASALDKNTLLEIEVWATENDLQLLIERADYEAGEISYEIIEY